jgi:hypothetical protein
VRPTVLAALASSLLFAAATARADDEDDDAPPRALQGSGPTVLVRFAPETPDLFLLRRTSATVPVREYRFRSVTYYEGGYQYERVCNGACDVDLPVGLYRFALKKADRDLLPVEGFYIGKPTTITTSYSDLSDLRLLGLIIGVTGAAVGVGLIVGGVIANGSTGGDTEWIASGSLTFAVGIGAGAIIGLHDDRAHIHLAPLVVPASPATSPAPKTAAMREGMSVAVDF